MTTVDQVANTAEQKATTGADQPATEKQKAFIKVLEDKTGAPSTSGEGGEDTSMVKDEMTRAEASERIEELKNSDDAAKPVVPAKRAAAAEEDKAESNGKDGSDEKAAPAANGANGKHDDVEDGQASKKQKTDSVETGPSFENTKADESRTGGDVPATKKQLDFVAVLADKAGQPEAADVGKTADGDVDMTRNEASVKIDELKKIAASGASSEAAANGQTDSTATPPAGSHLAQPEKWATGGEEATAKQKGYIASLEKQAGETVDAGAGLNKAEASQKIEELKEKTS